MRILFATVLLSAMAAAQDVDFDAQIRPLLSDRCFTCHGPDAGSRKAGLRLDREADSRQQLESGARAIVPGDRQTSEIWRRITSDDPKLVMPPPSSKLTLTSAEREALGRWIDSGADYVSHWSFEALPERTVVPQPADDAGWCRNDIDRFVLTRLRAEGLEPNREAAPSRLNRRAAMTLTGLPPAGESVAIETLLASDRYAEHMAVHWLDLARYADTFGYQADVYREVWPWRDWVIRAFRDNLPYDQFATWQLAGDLLPDATRDQRLATAFQRLHRQTNEGGSVEEEFRVEYVADRVATFGTTFLGLTLECARCHDHKYDPVSQRDYYSMFALFDDIDESGLYSHFTNATPTPALSLPNPQQEKAEAGARARIVELEARLATEEADAEARFLEWLATDTAPEPLKPVAHFDFESYAKGGQFTNLANAEANANTSGGPKLVPGKVGQGIQLTGENNVHIKKATGFTRDHAFTIAAWLQAPVAFDRAVIWHRSRAWTDSGSRGYQLLIEDGQLSASLIHFWPGDAMRVRTRAKLEPGRWTHVAVTYDGSGRARGLNIWVDGERAAVDVVRDALKRTIQGGGTNALTLGQRFRDRGFKGGLVDELFVHDRELSGLGVRELARPGALADAWAQRGRPAARVALREWWWKELHGPAQATRGELHQARRARSKAVDSQRSIMVMAPQASPRTAHLLERGSYLAPGDVVQPDVPGSLPAWPKFADRDRLGLAQWLFGPNHPLTARVVVNRIWQMHFGVGLVGTPEDFGSQGQRPSHPKLLDWLARWFVESGWDLKALHRLILESATWRQDSAADAGSYAADPQNRLLARGPSFRLAAEVVRDSALLHAGLLVEKVGGPPVKPYQPPGLWREKSGSTYRADKGAGLYRRSLYTFWKRTSPPPSMMIFDSAKRDVCVAKRAVTATPLQALVLMNDPQHVEAARVLAERIVRDGGAVGDQLDWLFKTVVGRRVSAVEGSVLQQQLDIERAAFAEEPAQAEALLQIGERKRDDALPAAEVAAWTMVVQTVFSFDEVVQLR